MVFAEQLDTVLLGKFSVSWGVSGSGNAAEDKRNG